MQVLRPATAETTDVNTTPGIVPTMFETVKCPRSTSQYTFGDTGTWPGATMVAATNGDQAGYYIHVARVSRSR